MPHTKCTKPVSQQLPPFHYFEA